MWFSASVFAYDCLGQVQVNLRVYGDGGTGEGQNRELFSCATTVSGSGEDNPREWLRDALVAALEAL